MTKYPKATESLVIYNLPDEWFRSYLGTMHRKFRCVNSVAQVPPSTCESFLDEFDDMSLVTGAVFRQYLQMINYPEMTDLHEESYHDPLLLTEIPNEGRTVIAMPHYTLISQNMIEFVQAELLQERPLWRIRLNEFAAENDVIIYPDHCDFGGLPNSGSMAETLEQWREQFSEKYFRLYGRRIRMLQEIESRLPEKLIGFDRDPYRLLGVFETDDETSVWLMLRGDEYIYSLTASDPKEHESVLCGSSYPVSATGKLGMCNESGKPEVEETIVPRKLLDKLVVRRFIRGTSGEYDREWPFDCSDFSDRSNNVVRANEKPFTPPDRRLRPCDQRDSCV